MHDPGSVVSTLPHPETRGEYLFSIGRRGTQRDWWKWLSENSAAVTAVVIAVYALFTILLWWATKRQATLTQRTFDASNRP